MASTAARVLSRRTRRYQHFCPAARALETIGERWSLLIVRDLLAGPRRFSDLRRSLTAITPKWLSARLRALEADAIVTRGVTAEREVRYRLTPKGEALEPVFDALLVWGMDHALGPPRHGEAIHPGRAIDATVRYLNRRRVRAERHVVWVIHFGEDRSYTVRFDGARWSRQRGAVPADVTLQTSPSEWVKFLSADLEGRRRWLRERRARGTRQRLDELMTSFGAPRQTSRSREPGSQRPAMAKSANEKDKAARTA